MPCLNEAETIATCIKKAQGCIERLGLNAEIVISDNGSTDGSQKIAEDLGARVIHVKEKNQGYGSGIRWGVNAARGKYVIMGDSDDSYDWSKLDLFVEKLREGYDLVMGNRFKGGIEEGAMPVLHKYLGNPVLSWIGRLFFNLNIGDFNCGMRGFSKDAYQNKINPQTRGMDHASEIVVRAGLKKLKITEVPTTLSPDGRSREPHLRTWSDGWRVLRFLLLFSPAWLFLYPGIVLTMTCSIMGAILFFNPIGLASVEISTKSLIYFCFGFIIGIQLIFFFYFAKIYAVTNYISPKSERFLKLFDFFTLEKGLVGGVIIFLGGLVLASLSLIRWSQVDFGPFDDDGVLRMVLLSGMLITLGIQLITYSFVFSIQGLQLRWPTDDDEDETTST